MTLSLRLPSQESALLAQAASFLNISKSEFVRRSIAAYAEQIANASAETDQEANRRIDALFMGHAGGLRQPNSVKNPQKRALVEQLREKYGYVG